MSRRRRLTGFTLVEMMIVIAILGLLAAVAIPQFTSQREEGRVAAVVSNLSVLRTSIDSYWSQHNSFPGTAGTEELANQLLKNTNKAGAVGTGVGYGYGPYIRKGALPINPLTDTNTVAVVAKMPGNATGVEAWIYCHATGELRCNTKGAAPDGTKYFDL